jgi:hypothetical protein
MRPICSWLADDGFILVLVSPATAAHKKQWEEWGRGREEGDEDLLHRTFQTIQTK